MLVAVSGQDQPKAREVGDAGVRDAQPRTSSRGLVSIVGAGPGDPGLLTLKAKQRLEHADLVIADYLVHPAILGHCRPDAKVIQRINSPHASERLEQAALNEMLVQAASSGARVVRLKGGDPMVFGRGAEECAYLAEHGLDFEVVPGVSASLAAPAMAGIPVTHRAHTPAVCVVSGWEAYEKAGLAVAWEHLAKSAGTLVFMMSVRNARENAQRLIDAGRDPQTPAAVIRWGTRGIQRTVVATLATIGDAIEREGLRAPAVLVVGEVVEERERSQSRIVRPLQGRRIGVARLRGTATELVQALDELGADAFEIPVLVERALGMDSVALTPAQLRSCEGVIVTTPRAARALPDVLRRAGADLRALAGLKVLAIGPATARALSAIGIDADLNAELAAAEGVVEVLTSVGAPRGPWLCLRGPGARDKLANFFARAGQPLIIVEPYAIDRFAPSAALLHGLTKVTPHGEGVDVILIGSGACARALVDALDQEIGEQLRREVLSAAQIVALGPVTADACAELGLAISAVARSVSTAAQLEAIATAMGVELATQSPGD